MNWAPNAQAIAIAWGLNLELILVVVLLGFLPFRARRLVGYVLAILTFAVIALWRDGDPNFNAELAATEALIANMAVMYFLKAYFIGARSRLGRAMAINNYALACFFIAAQIWLLWDGGWIETRIHYLAYAIVLWTVNMVITELMDPHDAGIGIERGRRKA